MANPDPLPLLTRPQVAMLLGVNPVTITKWEREGFPIHAVGKRGHASQYDAAKAVAWLVQRERERLVGGDTGRLDPLAERARRDAAQANLAEQQHAIRAGTLVPKAEVHALLTPVVVAIRAKLLAAPRAWAPVVARAAVDRGAAGVEAVLTTRVREVLTALATLPTEGA